MKGKLKNINKFQRVWAYSLVGILVLVFSLYFANISTSIDDFSTTISLPAYTIIPGILVIMSFWALSRSSTIPYLSRNSLLLLTISFTCWFIAEQTWNLYEHVLEIDPYPSLADFFYLAAPIFMLFALVIFLKNTNQKISKKNTAFAFILSTIILIPSVLLTIESGLDDDPFEIAVALTYPIVDAMLLVPAIITTLFLISNKKNFFWLMITCGIIIFFSADTIFLFLVINNEYVDGHPVDILWITSYIIWLFMMFYAIIESKTSKQSKEFYEFNKKIESKKIEKYGILIALILINTAVGILLYVMNYFTTPKENSIQGFFSLILIMTVVIFSAIVILLNSKLNKTLQNRTIQLEETSKELIKSERFSAIGELASRISHDIRNPLSNILMSIELIRNSPSETKIEDKNIVEKFDLISKNIERISHQINDVLGFVKNQPMNKKYFNALNCINETIDSVSIPKNIKIQYPEKGIKIWADPFQIQIACNNLIINAIQAIGKEKGEIRIRFLEDIENTIIEIENSGPRIPEEILPHIFDSLVTTKQVGTGLGLVSCKTIIENHGGTIQVKNNPTTFTIKLPKKH